MYICTECERTFTEPGGYEEHHPYGMGYASESFDCCPYCDSTEFEEATRCERCGEWVIEVDDNGYCGLCAEEMYEQEE